MQSTNLAHPHLRGLVSIVRAEVRSGMYCACTRRSAACLWLWAIRDKTAGGQEVVLQVQSDQQDLHAHQPQRPSNLSIFLIPLIKKFTLPPSPCLFDCIFVAGNHQGAYICSRKLWGGVAPVGERGVSGTADAQLPAALPTRRRAVAGRPAGEGSQAAGTEPPDEGACPGTHTGAGECCPARSG